MKDTNEIASPEAAPPAVPVAVTPAAAARGLARKLAIMVSGTAATVVLLLVQSVVVARLLGPAQLGRYAPLMVTIALVAQLNDFGLANAFAYYARHRPRTVRTLITILGQHLIVCAGIATALVLLAWVSGIAGLTDARSPAWFAATIVVAMVVGTPNAVLPVLVLARGEYRAYTLFVNGATALYILAVLGIGLVYGPSWRAFVVASVVVQELIAVLEWRFLRSRPGTDGETITRGECYRYGMKVKWAELMKMLGSRLDLLVTAAVLAAPQVGQYSLAVAFREAGMIPLRTYGAILQNLLVDRQKSGTDDRDLILGTLLMQSGLSLTIWAAVAVALAWIVPLFYGAAYVRVSGPAAVLFGSTVFLSIAGICFIVFNMDGRPSLSARVVTAGGVIAPPLVWVLSRHYGLYGAAVAGLASAVITALIAVIVLIRVRRFGPGDVWRVAARLPTAMRHLGRGLRTLPRFTPSMPSSQP